ncbi:hypothetical protein OAG20_01240 [Verrucomicrobiales bacterium]|nr:hypothetical protein [Verrucomicrobiales bacterium]
MTKSSLPTYIVLLAAVALLPKSYVQAQVSPDLVTLNWDASMDDDGNNAWDSAEDPPTGWTFGGNTATVKGTTNFPGVNAWFAAPKATMVSFHDLLGNSATQEDASWELIFRPGSFDGSSVLFETGGNVDGMGLFLEEDVLEFRAQDANSDDQRIIINTTLEDPTQFYHVVATIKVGGAGENEVELFVDGESKAVGSAEGDLLDWAGGDDAGLGQANAAVSTGQGNFAEFVGDIATFRYYRGEILAEAEVAAEFDRLNASDDSDGDGLIDSIELLLFGNLDQGPDGDPDGDTISTKDELAAGTNPSEADSDKDGLDDNEESALGTNPLNPDTDDDRLMDGVETKSGTFVDAQDSGTDPTKADTDGDGLWDGWEVINQSNPVDAASKPAGSFGTQPDQWLNLLGGLNTYHGQTSDDLGPWDLRDVSFLVDIDFDEKLDDTREIIWESGGGTVGFSIVYEVGSKIVLRKSGNGGIDVAVLEYALSPSQIAKGEILVGWTYDIENDDFEQTVSLIVDNELVEQKTGDYQADWTGDNPAAFGVASGAIAAGGDNTTLNGVNFTTGTINLTRGLRMYLDQLFEPQFMGTPFGITRVEFDAETNRVTLTWESSAGEFFRIERSESLMPGSWVSVGDAIPAAAGPATVTEADLLATAEDPEGFYRVAQVAPPAFYEEGFESGLGQMTFFANDIVTDTIWEAGAPSDPPGVRSGQQVAVTTLDGPFADGIFNLENGKGIGLRSPVLDISGLVGPVLTFQHRLEVLDGQSGVRVNVIAADGVTEIQRGLLQFVESVADWEEASVRLPDEVLAAGQVILEWELLSVDDGDPNNNGFGWAIDDVTVD